MKLIALIGITVLIGYLVALVLIVTLQRSLMYHPGRASVSPALAGLPLAQTLALQTSDSQTLVAWYVPATGERPLLLYFHGNAGSLADRASVFAALTADGYGLLAVSYRGYSGSTGSPTEAGLHLDALAAYDAAVSRGYPPARIVALGESLGTGVAVALAAEKPLAGLILEAPYSSTADVAAALYWMFPVRLLMIDQYRSDRWIRDVRIPLLIMHGENDGIIPIRFGERLFGLANEPKEFVRVGGAGHLFLLRPGILPRIEQWLDTYGLSGRPKG